MARFAPRTTLALAPEAYGLEFNPPAPRGVQTDRVAVVEIVGPLEHHVNPNFASYDGIKARVRDALAGPSACVLLSIDSPGGVTDGAFDCVTELRALAAAAGKPLFTYVDAHAESAGYALATAGDRIFIPPAGCVGSIGVIGTVLDTTAADAAVGVVFEFLTTGARKTDANPHVKLTDASRAALQLKVDAIGEQFFALVAERRGLPIDTIRGFQAGVFVGADAIRVGLADQIATFDQVLALLSADTAAGVVPVASNQGSTPEVQAMDEILKSLRAIADDDKAPAEDRDKARAALAAMEPPKKDEPDGDEKAEHTEPDGDEPKDKEKAVAVNSMLAQVNEQFREELQKQTLISARADLPAETRAELIKLPLASVKTVLRTLPKPAAGPVAAARAALDVKATTPENPATAPATATGGFTQEQLELRARMGFANDSSPIAHKGTSLSIQALTPDRARRVLADLQKGNIQ
jgi:signal peptide peptidase SppA